jgi:hypothetical protein
MISEERLAAAAATTTIVFPLLSLSQRHNRLAFSEKAQNIIIIFDLS